MATAMLFGSGINLDQSELFNGVIHKSTSLTRPANPVVGQISYDTDLNTLVSWNGTAWASMSDQDAVLSIVGTAPIQASEDGNRQVTISVDSATDSAVGVIKLAGDLAGSATLPSVSGVGYGTANAESAAAIHTAVGKAHDQNTDTGTTSATFQVGSSASGPKLKNNAGILEVRNAADSALASLRVDDLHVEGDLTYVHSTDVYLGDSFLTLNAQVMDAASNSSGGLDIKRLLTDTAGAGTISGTGIVITGTGTSFTTVLSVGDALVFGAQRRTVTKLTSNTEVEVDSAFSPQPDDDSYSFANQANARIYFDNSAGIWKVIDGATSSLQTFALVRKFSQTIGDGTAKDFTITHNLNTQDVNFSIRLTASDFSGVITDWKAATVNTVTVHFNKIPTSNQYRVTITG